MAHQIRELFRNDQKLVRGQSSGSVGIGLSHDRLRFVRDGFCGRQVVGLQDRHQLRLNDDSDGKAGVTAVR